MDRSATNLVSGGRFFRSNDPEARASVSPFYLDRFEITVGRFRRFVTTGKGTQASPPAPGSGAHPKIAESGWQPSFTRPLTDQQHRADQGAEVQWPRSELDGRSWNGEARPMVAPTRPKRSHFASWTARGCPPKRNGPSRPQAGPNSVSTRGSSLPTPPGSRFELRGLRLPTRRRVLQCGRSPQRGIALAQGGLPVGTIRSLGKHGRVHPRLDAPTARPAPIARISHQTARGRRTAESGEPYPVL